MSNPKILVVGVVMVDGRTPQHGGALQPRGAYPLPAYPSNTTMH